MEHSKGLRFRRLLPVGLTGTLTLAVIASAILSVGPSSTLSPEAQSKQFHADVQRTLASRRFTVRALGQVVDYQAPNRTRVVEISPDALGGGGISIVTIGSSDYAYFGPGQWSKLPFSLLGGGGVSQALGYLRALSAFKSATLDGDVYTVHGIIWNVPEPIVTLVFSTVTKAPSNASETSFGSSANVGYSAVIGHITVHNGFVTSETFTTFQTHGPRRTGGSRSGSVTYSDFGSSPAIGAPTKADLVSTCQPGPTGSCQYEIKIG